MDLTATCVALAPCQDYESNVLVETIDRMWASCNAPARLSGAHVLLKPNLISARPTLLACTEGAFILAAARWFADQGSRVSIGDSPAFGTAESALAKIGIVTQLDTLGVRIADFSTVRNVTLPSGIQAGFAADALDCDLLVNLPRIKAHAQLRVTMAVKNYFGCIVGMRKPLWHMRFGGCSGQFTRYLVELLSVLPNGVSLVDGITTMHRDGPIGGKPFQLGITGCSPNPVALDRALLDIIGVAAQDSLLMRECERIGLRGSSSGDLSFPLNTPCQLAVQGFEVPAELSPVRFNPFRFGKNSMRRLLLRMHSG